MQRRIGHARGRADRFFGLFGAAVLGGSHTGGTNYSADWPSVD